MPIVNRANGLLAEFAIFPVEPESQANLVEYAIQNIESALKPHTGFASGTVLRSRDGLRVTSYVQWADQGSYVATQPFTDFATPDVHLFEIFAAEPAILIPVPKRWFAIALIDSSHYHCSA